VRSVGALGFAAWTGLTLKLNLFQHPRLIRHTYRFPEESLPARVWRSLKSTDKADYQVSVELRPESIVWVKVEGQLLLEESGKLVADLRTALKETEDRLVLDLAYLVKTEKEMVEWLGDELKEFYDRIRVVPPQKGEFSSVALLLATYS
jgi:hypothetical protein